MFLIFSVQSIHTVIGTAHTRMTGENDAEVDLFATSPHRPQLHERQVVPVKS